MSYGKRKQLLSWIESGAIETNLIESALKQVEIIPSVKSWQRFFDQLLLWLGTAAIAVALIFFIAYNWNEMGRLLKFWIVESAMFAAMMVYLKFAEHPLISKASLLFATLSLGGLMALFGQTYQTGADPWQLFFNWSLLMLPWAMISQFSALWLIWLTLMNLSLILYYQVFSGFLGLVFSEQDLLWLLFALNTIALVCWEALTNILDWLTGRWAVRLIATASGSAINGLCLYAIFSDKGDVFPALIWLLWGALFYFVYRSKKQDLFMLAGLCLSGIVVITCFFARHLFENNEIGAGLVLALMVIGMGTGAAMWLKKVNKEWQS